MFTLRVLEEDIGESKEYSKVFETEEELMKYMDDEHGAGDEFEYTPGVPQRCQYDDTYFKTFTVTVD